MTNKHYKKALLSVAMLVAANMALTIPLSGAAIAAAQAGGAVVVVITLAGAAISGGAASAALTAEFALQGEAVAGATASAAFPDEFILGTPAYRASASVRTLSGRAKRRNYTTRAQARSLRVAG